ncbi:MAG: hypothetical protein J6Z34_02210 [Clostridia bacterium]|nr:hypothetical protein [Clostridia bacterium]
MKPLLIYPFTYGSVKFGKSRFSNGEFEGKTVKQIFSALGAKKGEEKDSVRSVLLKPENDAVVFSDNGKYVRFENAGLFRDTLRCNENGLRFSCAGVDITAGKIQFIFINKR